MATLMLGISASPALANDGCGQEDGTYTLTILHNNNSESALINYATGLEDFGGVARFAAVSEVSFQASHAGDGQLVNLGCRIHIAIVAKACNQEVGRCIKHEKDQPAGDEEFEQSRSF